MKLGCQASRARWRRLSSERLTLLGIRSLLTTSDISRISRKGPEREAALAPRYSRPTPIELRPLRLPIERERAALADGVGALEDPILPGGEAAEDLRLKRLRAAEAAARLDEREEALRRDIEALQDALHVQHDLAHEAILLVRGEHLVDGEDRARVAARLQRHDADGELVEPELEQRVVELTEGAHGPRVHAGLRELLGVLRLAPRRGTHGDRRRARGLFEGQRDVLVLYT